MSAQQWDEINYERVPSRASLLYRKAFWKHSPDKYGEYISKVESNEAKINTAVTYPYEIVREYLVKHSDNDRTLNAAWENLPNYITEGDRALVMADVSGSMQRPDFLPLAVSISLAMYFAERNPDPVFGGHFMTFSNKPELIKVQGKNLFERISNLQRANWSMNTDLQAAFKKILSTAVTNKLAFELMPTKLIICSDMEFDNCVNNTNYEAIEQKYVEAGYLMPTVVFWNVNARNSHSPVEFNKQGVMLVSGCSPTIFKNLMASKVTTPYDLMLEVLNDGRYARVIA